MTQRIVLIQLTCVGQQRTTVLLWQKRVADAGKCVRVDTLIKRPEEASQPAGITSHALVVEVINAEAVLHDAERDREIVEREEGVIDGLLPRAARAAIGVELSLEVVLREASPVRRVRMVRDGRAQLE